MSRKPTRFAYSADDQPAEEGDESLRSRTDARRENRLSEETLAAIARALVELPQKQLDRLGLSEELSDAVSDARLIESHTARARALRTVRIVLRDLEDIEPLKKRLFAIPGLELRLPKAPKVRRPKPGKP